MQRKKKEIKYLSKSSLLRDADLLVAREHELGPGEGLSYMFLALHRGEDGHCNLAPMDPDHCALGLSKSMAHMCLETISSGTGQ